MKHFSLVCECMKKEEVEEDQAHLNKPHDNKLYQQRLKPCCMLVITTQKVVTLFVLTGLLFLPIGIALLVQSTEIFEYDVDYTDCYKNDGSQKFCKDQSLDSTCVCDGIVINIPERVQGKQLMLLYGLKNYYQNHRLYRQSQSFEQLLGNVEANCLTDYCQPYTFDSAANKSYYPKGAVANSFFTDTYLLGKGKEKDLEKRDKTKDVTLDVSDISWKSDQKSKFLEPKNFDPDSSAFVWPKDWAKWSGGADYDKDVVPTTVTNQHFINWMNVAAFPSFTKLYAKIKLEPGDYTLHVFYRYPVHQFGGEKFVRIAETSWMGGRSLFLGSMYCLVGVFCLVAAVFFAVISRRTRAKRHERRKKIDEQTKANQTSTV